MRCGKHILRDDQSRTHQVWNCLEYFITHRMEQIPQSDLIAALWPDMDINEPVNALKNIIYRVRTLLNTAFPEETRPFIQNKRGHYAWNNAIFCSVDAEQFERLCRQASLPDMDAQQRQALLEQGLSLYQGALLPRAAAASWTAPLRTYYSHMYLNAAITLAQLFLEQRRFEPALGLCRQGIVLEPYDETLHALLIRTLTQSGDYKAALEHYEYAGHLFRDTLGAKIPTMITDLYNQIAKPMGNVDTDVALIEQSLRTANLRRGPFLCDFDLFRQIFDIYSSLVSRTNQAMSLMLFTITDERGEVPLAGKLSAAMQLLQDIALITLRKSDIMARFSPSQYILLLCQATPENCNVVFQRLIDRFMTGSQDMNLRLTQSRCSLLPAE